MVSETNMVESHMAASCSCGSHSRLLFLCSSLILSGEQQEALERALDYAPIDSQ